MNECKNKSTPECIELKKNVRDCREAGGETMFDCVSEAEQLYSRKASSYDDVYPWRNFDWDYTRYIDNNYNARKTGATSNGSMGALFQNTRAMVRLSKGFITDPNPDGNSKAAVSDLILCDRVPENNRRSCAVMNRIRQSYFNQPKPAGDFFNKKIDGKNSSSYFYKWGTCRTLDNEAQCKQKKLEWIGGKCYRPRFHFIKNEPGFDYTKLSSNVFTRMANKFGGAIQGNFPSAMNDILSFNPVQISKVYAQEPHGDYIPEKCPYEDKEHFSNYIASTDFTNRNTLLLLFFLLLCGFAILMWVLRIK
jgi:hypothetical protein